MKKVKMERKFVNSHENKENISLSGLGNTLSQPSSHQIFVELTLRKRQEMCLIGHDGLISLKGQYKIWVRGKHGKLKS